MTAKNYSKQIGRRGFLNASVACGVAWSTMGTISRSFGKQTKNLSGIAKVAEGVPNAEKLGWKVGVQVYTFHKFTLFEAIDMTASLGLKYLEAFVTQRINKDSDIRFGPLMSDDKRKQIKDKLEISGITLTSYYEQVNAESAAHALQFCNDMGMTILVTDPKRIKQGDGSIDFYEKLCQEHGVKMVITNHPKGMPYWDPDLVVADCQGRSQWIGASLDVGHYMRAGFSAKETFDKFMGIGKMDHFHFRDVDKVGNGGVDVPLGEGKANVRQMLTELHQKKLKPLFQLEYERDFDHPMDQLIPSVNYFNTVCGELLTSQDDDVSSVAK